MVRNLVAASTLSLAIAGVSTQAAAEAPSAIVTAGQLHPARLTARPGAGGSRCAAGTQLLKLGGGRTALMRATDARSDALRALLVALHGTGGTSEDGLWPFRPAWSRAGVVLVAPTSESRNWNLFYGSDLRAIDRALEQVFRRCRIDPRKVSVGGISDGAGTALTLGLLNGDLFRAVVALSPWGERAERRRRVGKPRIYVAHGTRDTTIPVRVSDTLVRDLRRSGYTVAYRRFSGGHEVPGRVSRDAVGWLLGR